MTQLNLYFKYQIIFRRWNIPKVPDAQNTINYKNINRRGYWKTDSCYHKAYSKHKAGKKLQAVLWKAAFWDYLANMTLKHVKLIHWDKRHQQISCIIPENEQVTNIQRHRHSVFSEYVCRSYRASGGYSENKITQCQHFLSAISHIYGCMLHICCISINCANKKTSPVPRWWKTCFIAILTDVSMHHATSAGANK